jgi:hypothetical protein
MKLRKPKNLKTNWHFHNLKKRLNLLLKESRKLERKIKKLLQPKTQRITRLTKMNHQNLSR